MYQFMEPVLRRLRGPIEGATLLSPGTVFYRRLTQLLSDFKLERLPTETQGEFARRAEDFLASGEPERDFGVGCSP